MIKTFTISGKTEKEFRLVEIRLSVFDGEKIVGNILPAQGLYKKMGFIECGRIPEAFRLDDGTTADEIVMYRKL